MQALVLKANGVLAVQSRPTPRRERADDVLVRVAAAGICGSDLPRAFGAKAYHYPLVMGHEFSGTVAEPSDRGRFRRGDRVAVFPLVPCHECRACSTGAYAQCVSYDYYGSRRDGGFAEYVVVPEENLRRVPDSVPLLEAALTEPCAVALHGVDKLAITPGMTAAVFGAGPVGLMTAMWLRITGCHRIYVADIDPSKIALARSLGFETIKGPRDLEPLEPAGVDRAVEAVGLPETYVSALRSVAAGGRVLLLGNIRGTLSIAEEDVSSILRREITVIGTWNSAITPAGSDEWTRVLGYIRNGIDLRPLISHVRPLADAPALFALMQERREPVTKAIVQIDESA